MTPGVTIREEYGGQIKLFMQRVLENRREQHYLLTQLEPEDYTVFNLTRGSE